MNGLAKSESSGLSKPSFDGLESVLLEGDLARLTPKQRIEYYSRVCESVGLNPLTQPFEYLKLNGRLILYAKRACTDQLRKIHRVSVTIVAREKMDGVYVVTARATMPDGREDESIGAVPIENLKGEALSNALMKAETKAKRRVTLAICGLSMMDETEIGSVQGAQPVRPGKPARTLDDVAGDGMYEMARVEDGDAAPHDEREDWEKLFDGGQKDQWGITMPTCPPPRFSERANPQFRGKLWSDPSISGAVFAKFLEEGADQMTSPQRAWAVYRATERQARKAHEAKQAEGKSNG